jgi:hypothetical protein
LRRIPAELCIRCKGSKLLCGLRTCPILERFRAVVNTSLKIDLDKESIEGSTPPSIVVGEKNYPKVTISFNIPPQVHGENAREYENPKGWWGKKSIYEIIDYRSSLVSNLLKTEVNDVWKLYEKELPLTAVSYSPVETESKLEGRIEAKLRFNGYIMPRGPSANVKDFKIIDNPKISKKLDKIIFDDIKAQDAIRELYTSGEDIYKIINAMSLGLIGKKKNRKLVPTRWAITAVDNAIGKNILNKIKSYQTISEIQIFYQKYLGNYFHIILYPSNYNVIWIEIWHPLSFWSNELVISELKENYWGEYDFLDGGYIAARTSILEYLEKIRRTAGIIIIREITSEYFAPLGNWHIRETVKNAMGNKLEKFDNLETAIQFVQNRLNRKVDLFKVKSIQDLIKQKSIDSFLNK